MPHFKLWLIFSILFGATTLVAEEGPFSTVTYQYGTVLSVKPIIEVVKEYQPTKVCYEQPTVKSKSTSDSKGAQIVGGIVGAVIGSKLGRKDSTKVLGATAGAIIGSSIGKEAAAASNKPTSGIECRIENKLREFERQAGYRVVYLYQGEQFATELPYDPGNEIKLRVEIAPAFDNEKPL
jgi:uncharacterized protein YcfJ